MIPFNADEMIEIDQLWRKLPGDHVWTGWAACGEAPTEIWIFRTRAHWRKFPLFKTETGYRISDESGETSTEAPTLQALLNKIEAIPGLKDPNGSAV